MKVGSTSSGFTVPEGSSETAPQAESRPTCDLILRCRLSGLEGGLQPAARSLEPSFEAVAPRPHSG